MAKPNLGGQMAKKWERLEAVVLPRNFVYYGSVSIGTDSVSIWLTLYTQGQGHSEEKQNHSTAF